MSYSEDKKQYSVLNRRTFFLYLIKLSFFSTVGWRLYDIQIADSKKYITFKNALSACPDPGGLTQILVQRWLGPDPLSRGELGRSLTRLARSLSRPKEIVQVIKVY